MSTMDEISKGLVSKEVGYARMGPPQKASMERVAQLKQGYLARTGKGTRTVKTAAGLLKKIPR